MAHDLFLGKTNRNWSLDSVRPRVPSPNATKIEHLLFNKWTAALAVGGIATSTLLITTIGKK